MGRPRRFEHGVTLLAAASVAFGLVACGQDPGDEEPDAMASPDAALSDGGGEGLDAGSDAGELPDGGSPITDPGEPGSESATTWTEQAELTANGGAVTLPVTLHAPASAGPHPVVVFTHGFQLAPADYASYGAHLATWGYFVVMPELPGGLLDAPTHLELKGILRALLDWVDTHASDSSGPLRGQADPSQLVLAGHSMGGKLSLLVASEDSRPDAVFGVDPVDAGGGPMGGDPVDYPSVTPELMPQITVPLVLLGETVNATGGGLGQACAPAEDNFHQYYEHAASPALEVEVLGANHMSFLDNPDCGLTCSMCPKGTDDPAVTRRLTRRTLTAFLQAVLRQQTGYRTYLTGDAMAADVSANLVTTASKNGF